MPLSLYDVTIPSCTQQLKTLSSLLEKGKEHCADEAALIDARLIDDMKNLAFQVRLTCMFATFIAVKVGHAENVTFGGDKTFPELQEMIKTAVELLEKLDPKCMDGMEESVVVFNVGPTEKKMTGKDYVLTFALPNFYFHFCTAYAILRKEGVPIGKKDYLGAK